MRQKCSSCDKIAICKGYCKICYTRERKRKLIAEGKCLNCRALVTLHKRYCEACQEKKREGEENRRKRYSNEGQCQYCRKPKEDINKHACNSCRTKALDRGKTRIKKYLNEGYCIRCGKPQGLHRGYCDFHYLKHLEYQRKYRAKSKEKSKEKSKGEQ